VSRSYAGGVTADDFRFVGGRASLDLIATLGKRHADPVERLPDGAAAAAWLVQSGVLPKQARPIVTARQLADLRMLREVINRLVRATMAGRRLGRSDVAALNAAAARPGLVPTLVPPGVMQLTWGSDDPVDVGTSHLARDAVTLLAEESTHRIKECANPDCSLLYFDDSQSLRRRWCSMERCGNLAKIHAYRRRLPH